MPENFFITSARKITAIEKAQRENVPEIGYSMGDVIGSFQSLVGLRGFWPFSSADNAGAVYDLSAQGRLLTWNNVGVGFYNNIVPITTYNGINAYFSRPTEAGLAITNDLTFGGWFLFNNAGSGNFIGKLGLAGQFGFSISHTGGAIKANVSSNGTLLTGTALMPISQSVWHFVVARYTPSTELSITIDGIKTSNIVGIPAAIFASTAAFQIGASSANAQFMNGAAALCFICNYVIPDVLLNRLYNLSRGFFVV